MAKRALFDRDDVINKAKDLYWEKGYHGTSMRALQDALDMRPGSIYAAFGSKDNLFKEAIQHYSEESGEILTRCMQNADSNINGLKAFIKTITVDGKKSAPSGMCMVVKSIAELTETDNPELLSLAKQLLGDVESELSEILTKAIEAGEISSDKDAVELARYVQVQIIGLRTFALATDEIALVETFIDSIFEDGPFR
ncbi:TetR family transcriptional regulator [Vibrio inusitatus NBRC 102082]|uniref:TetR family transcriptional regulator n=1 Tax=Vibrio inusitatus NBRC 102082 TaxID=1219070 RepID=A0A4Y3HTD1_9VIBR|nr:TetR/AcrR family transcriptional regulator [Vibrio inusitatus]GEA50308.1 TetR family transcriptional regulator [Vibrio inusitatus NBRC 102082]